MVIRNRIENERKKDTYDGGEIFTAVVVTLLLSNFLIFMILAASGAFDNPYKELGIDINEIGIKYFLEQYPEYEGCDIKYYPEGINNYEEVKGNCDGKKLEIHFKEDDNLPPLDEYFIQQLKEKGIWGN